MKKIHTPETSSVQPRRADALSQMFSLEELKDPVTRKAFLRTLTRFGIVSAGMGVFGVAALSLENMLENAETEGDGISPGIYREFPAIPVGNVEFLPIGVTHKANTFLMNSARIEEVVKRSAVINLEYFSPTAQEASGKWLTKGQEVLSDISPDSPASNFYAAVAFLAAQNNKEILVVNPETSLNALLEGWIALGFTGDVALHQIPVLIEKMFQRKLSRRSFLRLLPAVPGAIVLDGWKKTLDSVSTVFDLNSQDEDDNRFLGWTLLDYRDVVTALSLLRWNNERARHNESELVPLFHGTGHMTPGMRYYLQNPDQANSKLNFYIHHQIVADSTPRTFSFQNGKWMERREIAL